MYKNRLKGEMITDNRSPETSMTSLEQSDLNVALYCPGIHSSFFKRILSGYQEPIEPISIEITNPIKKHILIIFSLRL